MSKRSVFTNITPIPDGISRETVMETLRNHVEMIDLNPLVVQRTKMTKAPGFATAEEYHAIWYEIVDSVSYLPVPGAKSKVTYHGCFNDLPQGLQTHVLAPLGVDIRSRWLLGGNLPGEAAQPVELGLGIPKSGLYLREDVDLRCNIVFSSFVKKTLKKAHSTLVDRLLEKTKIREVDISNANLHNSYRQSIAQTGSPHLSSIGPASRLSHSSSVSEGRLHLPASPGMVADPAYKSASPLYQQATPTYPAGNPYAYHLQGQPALVPPGFAPPADQKDQKDNVNELPGNHNWQANQTGPSELPG